MQAFSYSNQDVQFSVASPRACVEHHSKKQVVYVCVMISILES